MASSAGLTRWSPCESVNKADRDSELVGQDETNFLCSPTSGPLPKVCFIYAKRCVQLKVIQSEKHYRSLIESLATDNQNQLIGAPQTLNDQIVVCHATYPSCGTTALCSTIPVSVTNGIWMGVVFMGLLKFIFSSPSLSLSLASC